VLLIRTRPTLKRLVQQATAPLCSVTETTVSVRGKEVGAVRTDGDAGLEATIRPLGRPGDLGWVVMAHGELYAAEFGWNTEFEALVAKIVADYAESHDPEREAAWVAEVGGQRVGCVFVTAKDADTAQLRILLVDPAARGHHLGQRLVGECLAFARRAGYRRMVLWTNHPLAAARHIYLAAGFSLVSEEPHHSFGADLIGQIYERDLAAELSATPR
jgi:GNAT superfamily N-acetyltransferase